jgi:uncharacterized membrane protein YkoI
MRVVSPRQTLLIALLAAPVSLGATLPSLARDNDHERRDAVRRASEAGEVLPLAEILHRVRPKISGDITGIDVEREHGRWRYELRVIDRSGRVLEILVDARSGEIEGVEER